MDISGILIYVAAIAILMAGLGIMAFMGRGKHSVASGHGDNPALKLSLSRFGSLVE